MIRTVVLVALMGIVSVSGVWGAESPAVVPGAVPAAAPGVVPGAGPAAESAGLPASVPSTAVPPLPEGMTATDVVRRMDEALRGNSSVGRTRMTIVTPSWQRTLVFDAWARGDDHSFIHILEPARERDTTFLKKGRLLYQYLPSAEMRIKISPSMMMQSWMGSDFTNDDLVRESSVVKDYTHEFLRGEVLRGRPCWVLRLTPRPDAAVVWGGIDAWVDVDEYVPLREEFQDERGAKVRILDFLDVRRTKGRPYPMRWSLTPLTKEGHTTIMETLSIEFDVDVPDRIFSLKNLERQR